MTEHPCRTRHAVAAANSSNTKGRVRRCSPEWDHRERSSAETDYFPGPPISCALQSPHQEPFGCQPTRGDRGSSAPGRSR